MVLRTSFTNTYVQVSKKIYHIGEFCTEACLPRSDTGPFLKYSGNSWHVK